MAAPSKKTLGKHRLKSRLGQGGMGVVYSAIDERLRREVAVKVLPKELAANDEAVRRFLREARAAARISHPNVVSIFDVDQEDGFTYLSMELMPGGSAQDQLAAGPLDWREATRLIADACRGLAAAHAAGLIHRDIKPANLMLAADGSVKVSDFGLVKDSGASQQTLTKAGSLLGTPQYMSPEQCQGEPLDARSDLYSLGATWYALLTGHAPFSELEPLQAMFAHCSREFPSPADEVSGLPIRLLDALKTATARSRSDRFGSANEMLDALQSVLGEATELTQVDSGSANTNRDRTDCGAGFQPANDVSTTAGWKPAPQLTSQLAAERSGWRRANLQTAAIVIGACIAIALFAFGFWPDGGDSVGDPATVPGSTPKIVPGQATGNDSNELAASFSLEPLWSEHDDASFIRSAAFSSDSARLFTVGSSNFVTEWDVTAKTHRGVLTSSVADDQLFAVAVSDDGKLLAAGGSGRHVSFWKLPDGTPLDGVDVGSQVSSLAFRPDGTRLAIGCDGELSVASVNSSGLSSRRVLATSQDQPLGAYMMMCVAYSRDGRRLASITWESRGVGVWNAETDQLETFQNDLPAQPRSVCLFDGVDAVLLGLGENGKPSGLFRWDFGTGKDSGDSAPVTQLDASSETGQWLAASRSRDFVISVGGWNQPAVLVDPATGQTTSLKAATLPGSTRVVALSPDDRLLAIGGGDSDRGTGDLLILRVASHSN